MRCRRPLQCPPPIRWRPRPFTPRKGPGRPPHCRLAPPIAPRRLQIRRVFPRVPEAPPAGLAGPVPRVGGQARCQGGRQAPARTPARTARNLPADRNEAQGRRRFDRSKCRSRCRERCRERCRGGQGCGGGWGRGGRVSHWFGPRGVGELDSGVARLRGRRNRIRGGPLAGAPPGRARSPQGLEVSVGVAVRPPRDGPVPSGRLKLASRLARRPQTRQARRLHGGRAPGFRGRCSVRRGKLGRRALRAETARRCRGSRTLGDPSLVRGLRRPRLRQDQAHAHVVGPRPVTARGGALRFRPALRVPRGRRQRTEADPGAGVGLEGCRGALRVHGLRGRPRPRAVALQAGHGDACLGPLLKAAKRGLQETPAGPARRRDKTRAARGAVRGDPRRRASGGEGRALGAEEDGAVRHQRNRVDLLPLAPQVEASRARRVGGLARRQLSKGDRQRLPAGAAQGHAESVRGRPDEPRSPASPLPLLAGQVAAALGRGDLQT
mmetsp:Transcript_37468/g.83792  ORF Transcript_37468/g.83792 Transcript_37468/m.83792 type:complete len:494 (+) Transcript_37468:595-2076(+)